MAKVKKFSPKEQVVEYFNTLNHPLKEVAEALRKVILATDSTIAEQIKWNSPAFYYTGEMKPFDPKEYKRDIVVFNLHKKEYVLLIFPTGAIINDTTGLLEGNFPDGRRTAKFSSVDEVQKNEANLQLVIHQWIKLINQ